MEEIHAGQLTASYLDKPVNIRGDQSGLGGVLISVRHDRNGTRLVMVVALAGAQRQELAVQLPNETPVFVSG
jgi:hypothetical protein